MRKEEVKVVEKVWGEELWLVNSDKYCGKMLTINQGAKGSYHSHNEKEETFYGLYGDAQLTVREKEYLLNSLTSPITVEPGELHSIGGVTDAVILEVSTPHSDDDVYRLEESTA